MSVLLIVCDLILLNTLMIDKIRVKTLFTIIILLEVQTECTFLQRMQAA